MTADQLTALAASVAEVCGFERVPPVVFRRGAGGDWRHTVGVIRIGRKEVADADRLWGVIAHELAHAQASGREAHGLVFWRRLAAGLNRAGRIELLRHDFAYREGAMKVAREYGLYVPDTQSFAFEVGQQFTTNDGTQWRIRARFRRAGHPIYRLRSRRWVWTVSENLLQERLLKSA